MKAAWVLSAGLRTPSPERAGAPKEGNKMKHEAKQLAGHFQAPVSLFALGRRQGSRTGGNTMKCRYLSITLLLTVSQILPAQTPVIGPPVNGASLGPELSPGVLAQVFGENLSASPENCFDTPPLPTVLPPCNAMVLIDGVAAPLVSNSAADITFQPGFPFWPWHGESIHPRCPEDHVFPR